MILRFTSLKFFLPYRLGILFLLSAFLVSSSGLWEVAQAQTIIDLPLPGRMVPTSLSFEPLQLKGILVNVKNPLRFDFLVDKGDSGLTGQSLKDEIIRSTKYFLTCLTVPEDDLWVNLSPYEKDRIVPGSFGITLMGKDLLEQDYLLKQIMASLSYPENNLGKRFWQRVYRKAYELYGTTEIPINTFNKVWIIPKTAQVYVQGNAAFVVNSQLDVMLEADYKAFVHHSPGLSQNAGAYSQVFRDVILPELRQEVNEGKNFALVRQVYNAMILATWYKRHLKDSLLGKMYVGRNEVMGVDIADKDAKEKIFQLYLKAYKKCVYNYIKEDYDPMTMQPVARKYASGGMDFKGLFGVRGTGSIYKEVPSSRGMMIGKGNDLAMATINLSAIDSNGTMIRFPDPREFTNTHPFDIIYNSNNRAMLAGLRKFLNKWTISFAFALALGTMFPTALQAASFTPGKMTPDGKVGIIMNVDNGDQLGKTMEQIRVAYKAVNPEEYKKSAYAGPLYAALGRVTDTNIGDTIIKGQQVQFIQSVPQNVLQALTGFVAKAVQSSTSTPAPTHAFTKTEKPTIVTTGSTINSPQDFYKSLENSDQGGSPIALQQQAAATPAASPVITQVVQPNDAKTPQEYYQKLSQQDDESTSALSSETPPSQIAGAGSPPPPPDPEDLSLMGKIGLVFGVLFGISGLGLAFRKQGYTLSGLLPKSKKTSTIPIPSSASSGPVPPVVSPVVSPTLAGDALNGSHLLDVSLPPSAVSAGEAQILAEDLAKVREIASGKISPAPLVNAQDDQLINTNNVWWKNKFKVGALLGASALLAGLLGYFTGYAPFLVPTVLTALHAFKGAGIQLGCGIAVFVKRVNYQGISRKEAKPFLGWFQYNVDSLTVRGGQQARVITDLADKHVNVAETKEMRNWYLWQGWDHGPVFFRNMINDLFGHFYKALPRKLFPVYNYAKVGVIKILAHVRFATGGPMLPQAAQPFESPNEKREVWVWDSVTGIFKKVVRFVRLIAAFNGDHDGSKIGVSYRALLKDRLLSFPQMRRFYSAVVHKYYEGRVTNGYLKRTLRDEYKKEVLDENGRVIDEIRIKVNYGKVGRELRKKGYIDFFGRVNHQFKGLDEEFKSWFPDYTEEIFNDIESALFGMPPGDGPILPLEQALDLTQGSWFASARYAHVMANHHNLEEAMDDVLFEKQGRAVGSVLGEVFDQVEPFITRRGYVPSDPEEIRTLNDCYIRDEKTAKRLGLEGQYEMIKIFKEMLNERMKKEALQQTIAGGVFRQWEQKWISQGEDPEHMRRVYINVAVEKFFTADNLAATKEFAESSDGAYGLYMSSSMDDSVTFYQDNQDVVIGVNRTEGYYGAASDPRVLKSLGPNGEKFEEVLHLKDGEIVKVSFSPSGKIIVRSWMRINGEWVETRQEELAKRFYTTAEYYYVDGVKTRNPYYAPPAVRYDNPRKVVQEDLQNTSGILAQAKTELDDPDSFNARSTDNLSQRITELIKMNGKARLFLIGFDNSYLLSEQFKTIMEGLVDKSKLEIIVLDANEFDLTPSRFDIQEDDIVLAVSKSGATSSTKLAVRLVKTLVNDENIFCMAARIDSVLNTMIGQGLRPEDPFTKRVFVTGEFYPAETPVVSEVLLQFQLQQLAVNLARKLGRARTHQVSKIVKFSPDRLEQIAQRISEYSIREAQEITGYDTDGYEYEKAIKILKSKGVYLGWVALEQFVKRWFMNIFVAGVTVNSGLLLSHHFGLTGAFLWPVGAVLNTFWISSLVPFIFARHYRKKIGRPKNAGHSIFQLFIAAPELISETQRNFFSRIMTNRFSLIGPTAILPGDPKKNFTPRYASDVNPNAIILRFYLSHKKNEGKMGVSQTTFPVVSVYSKRNKGSAETIGVEVNVPHEPDAAPEEIEIMDNTVGFLGQLLASKKIGVEMAKLASLDGRLFNLSSTLSSAGVYTTPINSMSAEARKLLDSGREKMLARNNGNGHKPVSAIDHAMIDPGGITMNSRLMQLKITGDTQSRIKNDDSAMSLSIIKGIVPRVSGIVPVTPDMLRAMLGEGYLN